MYHVALTCVQVSQLIDCVHFHREFGIKIVLNEFRLPLCARREENEQQQKKNHPNNWTVFLLIWWIDESRSKRESNEKKNPFRNDSARNHIIWLREIVKMVFFFFFAWIGVLLCVTLYYFMLAYDEPILTIIS